MAWGASAVRQTRNDSSVLVFLTNRKGTGCIAGVLLTLNYRQAVISTVVRLDTLNVKQVTAVPPESVPSSQTLVRELSPKAHFSGLEPPKILSLFAQGGCTFRHVVQLRYFMMR